MQTSKCYMLHVTLVYNRPQREGLGKRGFGRTKPDLCSDQTPHFGRSKPWEN